MVRANRALRSLAPALLVVMASVFSLNLAAAEGAEERIRENLTAMVPGLEITAVNDTEVDGFYEVRTNQDTVYVSADGRYVMVGQMLRLDPGEGVTNLTEAGRSGERREALDTVSRDEMITFSPEGEVRASIYVFTDIDCGYCRQMHANMSGYHEYGIEVNYLAFPRGGAGRPGYTKAVSAWCADDRNDAMDRAKAGERIPERSCDNPVDEQFELGRQIGVSGTPATLTEEGQLVPGYRQPADMAQMLGLE